MNRPILVALGATGLLTVALLLLVVIPGLGLKNVEPEDALMPYTIEEAEGRSIYVREGCMYCHSQQPRDRSQAPDEARGWGRASVPGDYTYDYPHQLGTMRTGPDLLNIGARQSSRDWHLLHLYQPRAVAQWSTMPAYRYLFETKTSAQAGDVLVNVPKPYAPQEGVVVARPEALRLVDYLVSLDRTYPTGELPLAPKDETSE